MSISEGQYNADWKECTIDELMHVQNGYAFKSSEFVGEEGNTYEVLKMGHIERGGGLRKSPKKDFIPRSDILKKWVLKKNDIVMAMTDMKDNVVILGVPALVDKDDYYALNQRVARLTLKDEKETDIKFIYNYLKWEEFLFDLQSKASSGVQVNLSTATIKESVLKIPPIREQKFIADALSSLDDKIDLLHRQNKTLEAMAETLFRQWFVEGAGDWESGKVSNLIDVLSGFAFKSTSFVENGIYRLMTIKAVQDGYLETNNAARITEVPANMPDYCDLQEGDVLLSLTGNVGRCCLVDDEKLLLNQRVAKLRPKNKRDHAFAYVMFRQISMRAMLEEMAKGTAQANLSPVEMANMAIQIPPDDVLSDFGLAATPMLKKLLFNKREIKTLEKLRDSLLPKLMSGEVRVA